MAEADPPPNARDVEPRIREEFLTPLIEAATVAFREVVNAEIVIVHQWETDIPDLTAGRTVAVEQQYSHGKGRLYLNVPSAAVREIARRMLSEVTREIDDKLAEDCLGEVLNVAAGQGKALLGQSRWHYSFGTPQYLAGPLGPGRWLVATFQSEFGPVRLVVALID